MRFLPSDPMVNFDGEMQTIKDGLTQRDGGEVALVHIAFCCWDRRKVVATTHV